MNETDRENAARERARQLGGFYRFVILAIGAIIFLGIINLLASDDVWVQWPALAIGIGVAIRAWRTFGYFGRDWEERKAAELMGQKPKRELEGEAEAEFFEE